MDFEEYQKKAHATAQYPTNIVLFNPNQKDTERIQWIYPALGLAGESGEILNKLKKVIRDQNGEFIDLINPAFTEKSISTVKIKDELGDALWYISELATALGLDLNSIAYDNTVKLSNRVKNGTIKGSGDNR